MAPSVMLVLPTRSYRAAAFLAAARDLRLEVVVAADEPSSLGSLMADRTLTLDPSHPEDAAQRAVAFAARHPVSAVVGVDEAAVSAAAHIAAGLGLRHSSVEAVSATRDKRELRRRLAACAIAQPVSTAITSAATPEELNDAAARVGFPCVVKPVDLAASRGVIRANTPAELEAAVARTGHLLRRPELGQPDPAPLLVESFIPGPEVAVEGLLDGGTLHVLAVLDKPDTPDGPFFEETLLVAPSRLSTDRLDQLVRLTEAAVSAIGLREGPIHAELRLAPAGAAVIEVAARSIGGRCSGALRFGDGESLEAKILRQACGLPLGDLTLASGGAAALMIPIPGAGNLERVEGVAAARAVLGVIAVDITVAPGALLEPLPEGDRYLGFLIARAADADGAELAARRALSALRIIIAASRSSDHPGRLAGE
jgi:biotin carboxylase